MFRGKGRRSSVFGGGFRKPRVLLLVDSPGWAYDTAAQAVVRHLSDEFEFRIAYASERPDLSQWPFDLVYVFWWGSTHHQKYVSDPRRVVKEISSHRWAEDGFGRLSPAEAARYFLADAGTLTATSRRLQDLFAPYREVYHTPNGFDPARFYFKRPRTGPLRLGWAGNQEDPCKGVNDVLRPAAGQEFELVVAGGKLKHQEMLEFYNSIDVLCVAATAEGEPLTLIEGLACGCFPVAVDVGIVPELVRDGENGLIVSREPAAFRAAFEWCARNLDRVREAGRWHSRRMLEIQTWEKLNDLWRFPLRAALKGLAPVRPREFQQPGHEEAAWGRHHPSSPATAAANFQ